MLKFCANALATLALLSFIVPQANAASVLPVQGDIPAKAVQLNQSPVPANFREPAGLILVRDIRTIGNGGGGGCWSHCYNNYDECMGLKQKPVCVSQMKTCMETCDRLTGLSNPTQRASSQPER